VKFILHTTDLHTPATAGGKATALARLAAAEMPVPPWFVVTPVAFFGSLGGQKPLQAIATIQPSAGVTEAIREALSFAPADALFAVRSSAVDEDGADHSFAGQLESFLNVPAAEVPARVADVWRSGFTERVVAYRRERGLSGDPTPPAVLVQRMVRADAAGVAFSADPVSGRRGIAIVSAVRGLGDKLVSGEADADTFHVNREGGIVSSTFVNPSAPSIRDVQADDIATLARRAAEYFGRPQDIEWAIEGEELYLLQSRPITTLATRPDPDATLRVWDNSNIAESYGGITTPLTYTFARRAYEEVYRQFCRIMGVPGGRIDANSDTFRCMIGMLRGRVYYNLASWYRVLSLLPGYTVNRRFMEQMMGVKEPLPADAQPPLPPTGFWAKVRDGFLLARTVAGLIWNHWTLRGQIRKFYVRLNTALGRPRNALSLMRCDELAAHYRDLERQLLTRWDAPLVNDFLAMIFYGVLRKVCEKWCGSPNGTVANDLIRDQGGIISAEPPRRMKELASMAAPHPALLEALRSGDMAAVCRAAPPPFRGQLDDYLQKFGDRCLDELKLESPTLHDDPATLLQGIAALAANPPRSAPAPPAPTVNPGGWFRRVIFGWVLRNARHRVRDRENLRFERTRLFGRVRRIFVEIGRRFHADGLLAEPRDIFFLTLDEALGFCDGTSPTMDLRGLVKLRRAEFDRWREMPAPADRCETRGIVNHAHDFQSTRVAPAASAPSGEERSGLGCCPGVVRGKVRVIRDPRGATILPGEILVAERTDPGWVLLFPSASGLLVERGSMLSHSAIVSRELGLPGIVSIPGLIDWLQTGDLVEMDGSTGVVRRIKE
jgi:rifampicin phosphotransferase